MSSHENTLPAQNNPVALSKAVYSYPQKAPAIQTTDRVREVVRGDGTMSDLLFDLISDASPHGFEEPVRTTIRKFLASLNVTNHVDKCGNLIAQVGRIGKNGAKTMFSSHMDTVHGTAFKVIPLITTGGASDAGYVYGASRARAVEFTDVDTGEVHKGSFLNELFKGSAIDKFSPGLVKVEAHEDGSDQYRMAYSYPLEKKRITLTTPTLTKRMVEGDGFNAEILGADDKVGCYIMCRLIEAKTPGLYVFHVGEEVGGIGSNYIVDNTPHVVADMQHCVAFDRHKYEDIITYQAGGRSASDEFAKALSAQLNVNMPPMNTFAPCDGGVFTDSANYRNLISECTNVSVGYFKQHWENEHFDLHFLEQILIPALKKVDWAALPAVRVPGADEPKRYRYQSYSDLDPNYDFAAPWEDAKPTKAKENAKFTGGNIKIPAAKKSAKKLGYSERNLNKVPAGMVTKNTPFDKVPVWMPDDGMLWGVPAEAMQIIIAKWILDNNLSAMTLAGVIFELYEDLENANDELDGYQRDELRGNL